MLVFFAKLIQKFNLNIFFLPIYYILLSIVQSYLNSKCFKIWSRNSLKAKAITPPVSDIDLTIIIKEQIDLEIIRKTRDRLLTLKGVDINAFDEKYINKIAHFANRFELKKDPTLVEQYNLSLNERPQDRLCFLLKTFQADYQNLLKYPNLKKKKWDYHFFIANLEPLPFYSVDSIIKVIAPMIDDFNPLMENFIRQGMVLKPEFDDFWYLTPNYYRAYSLREKNGFKIMQGYLNFRNQELLCRNFEWDVWGLFGQYHFSKDRKSFDEHLSSFSQLVLANVSDELKTNILAAQNNFDEFAKANSIFL